MTAGGPRAPACKPPVSRPWEPGSPDEIVKQVEGTNVRVQERFVRFETVQPMESLASLNKIGQRFRFVKVNRANLEDVFLNLTGRRLRD